MSQIQGTPCGGGWVTGKPVQGDPGTSLPVKLTVVLGVPGRA